MESNTDQPVCAFCDNADVCECKSLLVCAADMCCPDVLPCLMPPGGHWKLQLFSGSQAWPITFIPLPPSVTVLESALDSEFTDL